MCTSLQYLYCRPCLAYCLQTLSCLRKPKALNKIAQYKGKGQANIVAYNTMIRFCRIQCQVYNYLSIYMLHWLIFIVVLQVTIP